MDSDGAQLYVGRELKALTSHGEQPAILRVSDPDICAQLMRPDRKRPGLGRVDERKHLRNVRRP